MMDDHQQHNPSSNGCTNHHNIPDLTPVDTDDEFSVRLRREALEALQNEPALCTLLRNTVLAKGVATFEDAVATTMCYRLLLTPSMMASSSPSANGACIFSPDSLKDIFCNAMNYHDDHDNNADDGSSNKSSLFLENGYTMKELIRRDALAVYQRDPACESLLEVVLFFKGYAALVCHRAARFQWYLSRSRGYRSVVSLFLQSQASAHFGIDIHPCATIGCGVMFDHGTGIVIGETARVGNGCTLLHGVTLGGTGKDKHVDRHPKVGDHVLVGANASILGNITIGNRCKIGAGSVVIRPIPAGVTAVGAPAKIIGTVVESKPGSHMDETLGSVSYLHKSESVGTMASLLTTTTTSSSRATSPETTTETETETTTEPEATTTAQKAAAATETTEAPKTEKQEEASATSTTDTISASTAAASIEKPRQEEEKSNDAKQETKEPARGESSAAAAATTNDDGDDANNTSSSLRGSESCLCPFREYKRMGDDYKNNNNLPKNAITIDKLQKILKPLGCSRNEIGSIFIALDTKQVGYVTLKEKCIMKTMQQYCCSNSSSSATTTTLPKLEPKQVLQQILLKCNQ